MIVCSLRGLSLKCIRLKAYIEQTLVQRFLRCFLLVCFSGYYRLPTTSIAVRNSVAVVTDAVLSDDQV
jgi:hypothetical protein